jgi:hypothetical protein
LLRLDGFCAAPHFQQNFESAPMDVPQLGHEAHAVADGHPQ